MLDVTLLYLVTVFCTPCGVQCGFARPQWKVHLREPVPLEEGTHAGVDSLCCWGAGWIGAQTILGVTLMYLLCGTPCGQNRSTNFL